VGVPVAPPVRQRCRWWNFFHIGGHCVASALLLHPFYLLGLMAGRRDATEPLPLPFSSSLWAASQSLI